MIFHFQILSQEHKDFRLEVELSQKHTFFDFHSIIQKSLGYESHQLASFFVSDQKGLKEKEISLLDLGMNGAAYYIMQKTNLSDLIFSKGQKLIYTFDFLNDRSLLIELTEMIMEKNLSEPMVTLKLGETPQQVLGEDVELIDQESMDHHEEKAYMLFGDLEDYT
jgi:Plasmid pRiA4b ORF-3-like protein